MYSAYVLSFIVFSSVLLWFYPCNSGLLSNHMITQVQLIQSWKNEKYNHNKKKHNKTMCKLLCDILYTFYGICSVYSIWLDILFICYSMEYTVYMLFYGIYFLHTILLDMLYKCYFMEYPVYMPFMVYIVYMLFYVYIHCICVNLSHGIYFIYAILWNNLYIC